MTTITGVGANAAAIATNPVTNKVYIATNNGNASTVSIVDGASNTATSVTAGGDPADIAINSITNKVYVVGRSSNSVTVIDGATNSTLTVPVGLTPQHAVVNSVTNKIYVSNSGGNSVTVIDGATNSTSTIAMGGSFPSSICVNPATNKVYVANQVGNSVAVIDGLTNSISSVPVGTSPIQVVVNSVTNKVYVANSSSSSVTVIDGTNNSAQTVSVQGNPAELLVNPVSNIVFVTYTGSPQLTKIDGATNSTFTLPLGPTNVPYTQLVLAMNLVTNKVYVNDLSSGFLLVIDGQTDEVSTVEVLSGVSVFAVNPINDKIYVSTTQGLAVIDASPNQISTFSAGNQPANVAINQVTGNVYVTNYQDNTVTVIGGPGNTNATVATGQYPSKVAVNPITNKVYVSNSGSNSVTVIDGADNSTVTVSTGAAPTSVAVNPVTNKIYVANYYGSSVTVINGSDNSTITVATEDTPSYLAINPVTDLIYVSTPNSNILTVIDGATNSTSQISLVNSTADIAVNPVTNQIYVENYEGSSISVIDGATRSVTGTVPLATTPGFMALNSITNKLYVSGNNTITVIDGSTLTSTTLTSGAGSALVAFVADPVSNKVYGAIQNINQIIAIDGVSNVISEFAAAGQPSAIAVNPVTNQIYATSFFGGHNVIVSENLAQSSPLTDAITPLPNNQTTTSVPEFKFTASSATAVQPQAVFYQFDTVQGSWTKASGSNPTFVSASTTLEPGVHTLFAYATNGEESTSQETGKPTVGAIQAYTFLVVPAMPAAQTITFVPIGNQVAGAPLTLMATASSGLNVGYSSSTPSVCTVSGSVATLIAAGTCTITASQSGNANYSAAQPVTQSFSVIANTPVNGSPVISSIRAVAVGGNSGVISWVTDQPSTSQVLYGSSSSYGQSTAVDSSLVTNHMVTVSGLSAGSTYNYAVVSANSSSASTTSQNSTITISPYVGYVAFWGVSNSGVTISWSTDAPANSFVAYGTSNALGQLSPVQSALSNAHGVMLSGLNAGTTYYFRAESTTDSGNTGASTLFSFTTTGGSALPAPVITNVAIANPTATSATITWTTDQPASSQVNYGLTSGYGSSSPLDSSLVIAHSVTLSGLIPGTTYNFDVVSRNAANLTTTSDNGTFVTTASSATPPYVGYVVAWGITDSGATVTWSTDIPANTQLAYGTTSALGTLATPLQPQFTNSHGIVLTGLNAGTTYYFVAQSTGANGATGHSSLLSFTTSGTSSSARAGHQPRSLQQLHQEHGVDYLDHR